MYTLVLSVFLSLILTACNAQQKSDFVRSDLQTIPVELTTHLADQQQFIAGDEIQFLLSLGKEAYVYMFHVDATNKITRLLPNKYQQSSFYDAGYFFTIPEYDNGFRFTVSEPYGEQSVWIFASDQLISKDNEYPSITEYKTEIIRASKSAYGEYELKIVTKKQ